ncbi:MAG: hypothetical protein A2V90_02965 [Gammaproteobacteria bacterium RBG_16_57_12]|nr:MAG: hypothetical protein A2V90_02965 [Gammaproteobacteria bacterium RBG_16_57_12]
MSTSPQYTLYVEDEPDIQTIAQLALEQVGNFSLTTCSSGQEALDRALDLLPHVIFRFDPMNRPDQIRSIWQRHYGRQ